MNREDIDKLLTGEKNEALEAHLEIVSIQKDKSNLLKVGQEWLDDNLIGGLNNKLLFLGSRPSNGKTYHCSQTINNLLDRNINPMPVSVLRLNLEMQTTALVLREVSKALNRKPSEILSAQYTEEEKPIVTKVVNSFMDDRITNVSATLKGENFKYLIQKFISGVDAKDEKETVKTKKVVIVDHLHIYIDKNTIDEILVICNELKLQDKNLSFIFYFQLGRTIEDLWRESRDKKVNPKRMLPDSTFIYQTDVLHQVADLVVGMVIPQIYELDLFAAIHKERNKHLKEHFSEDSSDSDWTRLKGRNRIYYNIFKKRMSDDFDDPKIFCSILNPANEEKANALMKENTQPFSTSITTPTFNQTHSLPPVFEEKPLPAVEFKDLHKAFESSLPDSDKNNSPF